MRCAERNATATRAVSTSARQRPNNVLNNAAPAALKVRFVRRPRASGPPLSSGGSFLDVNGRRTVGGPNEITGVAQQLSKIHVSWARCRADDWIERHGSSSKTLTQALQYKAELQLDEIFPSHSLPLSEPGYDHFGGNGSILSRMRMDSSITLPTICRLCGLSLSIVSCGVCQKTLL